MMSYSQFLKQFLRCYLFWFALKVYVRILSYFIYCTFNFFQNKVKQAHFKRKTISSEC